MKKLSVVFLLLCSMAGGVSAQRIELKGVIRDAGNSEAMAFVNVVLQTPDSAFVAGTTTDDDGKFVIPDVKPGDYRLAVSYVGYVTQYIALEGLRANVTLPEILMEEETFALDAVTVTASAVTNRIDRKLIFPTEQQVQVSSNGVDLLQQLMLPRILINAMTREVSMPGSGEVQLRVNGVKAEANDVAALLPKDIIRVEYHDNPGLRYGNAATVIDFIVRRPETGGNLGVDIYNAFKLKKYGRNGVNAKVSHGKSEFSMNYLMQLRNFDEMWRDNEETFHFADGSTLLRRETGEPGHVQYLDHYLNMAYSFLNDRRMFNATFRYYLANSPHWDYVGKLHNMENPGDYVQMFDGEKRRISRPALDLYYQENLKNDQTLVVNLVGTYNYTDNNRVYTESRDGMLLTGINNSVAGNKYSWIGEGIYEKRLGDNRLSAGLRHTQAYADNTYGNGHGYTAEMQQGETFLYGEWKGRVRKLDYTLGAGVTRSSFRQEAEGVDYSTYTFNPRVALFLPLPGNSSIRLTGNIRNGTPSLSELSAVEQSIDSLQIQRGNPGLQPCVNYESVLSYEWKKSLFSANLEGRYNYRPSAIMEEKFWENNKIVQTWDNQKSWQHASAILHLRVGPVKDIATLALHGGVNHFVSNGNNYRHVCTEPYFTASLNVNYRNFRFYYEWQPAPWSQFYGETLQRGEVLQIVSLGYKYRDMNFGVQTFNPFFNDYRMDTENKSAYASYKRSMYVNDFPRLFVFTFSWNINFGRTFQSGQKRLNNSDDDAGVMNVGK
jgi:hypothetical protein